MTASIPVLSEDSKSACFHLKQEQFHEFLEEDNESNDSLSSTSSILPIPKILGKNITFIDEENGDQEFLRLTSMVREAYLAHLHKSLLGNYATCFNSMDEEKLSVELKRYAEQIELNVVRASLEANLYRTKMLKIISDIKSHTSLQRIHKKLQLALIRGPITKDMAVQTTDASNFEFLVDKKDESNHQHLNSHIQSAFVTSNFEDNVNNEKLDVTNPTQSNSVDSQSMAMDQDLEIFPKEEIEPNDPAKDLEDIFQLDSPKCEVENVIKEDEDSQDSIMQHMEDMFCGTNDCDDIEALIDKHSGVSKAAIDLEIGKMCGESPLLSKVQAITKPSKDFGQTEAQKNTDNSDPKKPEKLSLSSYKKRMKQGDSEENNELNNSKVPRTRVERIWFVERIHQEAKLREMMLEISLKNYRKHGRIEKKFIELFGEPDEEDKMPESPICIEDHLGACKERIAPYIVKHLMPYYKKKRIKDRSLFKEVAKHISDMLIIEDTFPEEHCISRYIRNYFKHRKTIETKAEVYM